MGYALLCRKEQVFLLLFIFLINLDLLSQSHRSCNALKVAPFLATHRCLPKIDALWQSASSCFRVSSIDSMNIPYCFSLAVWSLYDRCQSLVRIAGSKSDAFPVRVGLRQGCPLSPILFIIFMDRISRRSQGVEGFQFGNLRIGSLLFADDVVLLASLGRDLQLSLERFAAEFEAAGMRISTSKS